jgi:phosphinothricin acetyltransferase
VIRIATPADAGAIAAIYRPFVDETAVSFELEPPDAAEMERRIAGTLPALPWLVLDRGEVQGYAYASRHRERAAYRWSVDSSVYVAAGHRRAGVGRALYTALFALLRAQGYRAVHGGVTLPNAPSVGLHEALGFAPVGVYRAVGYKLGGWHDVGWWQLALRPPAPAPAEPCPVGSLAPAVIRAALAEGEALLGARDARSPASQGSRAP